MVVSSGLWVGGLDINMFDNLCFILAKNPTEGSLLGSVCHLQLAVTVTAQPG